MSAPSTPSPKSSWSRMRGAVRRASTVLIATKPPSVSGSDRDADTASLKGSIKAPSIKSLATSLLPSKSHPAPASAPSPIAESPAREFAASRDDLPPLGASPLSQSEVAEPTPIRPPTPPPDAVAAVPALESQLSPTSPDYYPPPLIDSTATGPGGFTDDPDELPQPQVIHDPFIPQPVAAHEEISEQPSGVEPTPETSVPEPTADSQPQVERKGESAPDAVPVPVPEAVPAPRPEPAAIPVVEPAPAPFPEPAPEPAPETAPEPTPEPAPEPAVISRELVPTEPVTPENQPVQLPEPELEPELEPRAAPEPIVTIPVVYEDRTYFDIPLVDEPAEEVQQSSPIAEATEEFKQAVEENSPVAAPPPETPPQASRELPPQQPDGPAPVPQVMPQPEHNPVFTGILPLPIPVPMPGYDLGSGQDVWRDAANTNNADDGPSLRSVGNGNAGSDTQPSDVRVTHQDPFVDPPAPRITVSHADYEYAPMPVPQAIHQPRHDPSGSYYDDNDGSPVGIVMPLPPINHVIPARSLHESPRSLKSHVETDETLPLLSRPHSPPKSGYLRPPSGTAPHVVTVSPPGGGYPSSSSTWALRPPSLPRLQEFGWIEYQLPDGIVYYVHPTRRITTDIDLREDRKLDAVNAFLDRHRSTAVPIGMELWIREGEITKRGFVPINFWVDHSRRVVIGDQDGKAGKKKHTEDDQLDIEYRYWSFIESHPAHVQLPQTARAEALDVLTWAWTDRLLPSDHTAPAPFAQEECQELMSLLRSFGSEQETGFQAVVHSRIVARILLRLAQWRQQFFRPNKPLPTDVGSQISKRRRPFIRTAFDFVISCLCLGIPYFFFDRHRQARFDEESGGLRSPGPMLVLGACTCLIAAIVLSASVTFLSLPGLDSFARIAGLVAILCASFSITSTGVAIFRYKTDLERPVTAVGMEGLMLLSRRSFVMSLPLVFLAYAIIGFVVGIVLYTLRGVTVGPVLPARPFDDYTRWTVVGVLGGLGGVLSTSLLLLRG